MKLKVGQVYWDESQQILMIVISEEKECDVYSAWDTECYFDLLWADGYIEQYLSNELHDSNIRLVENEGDFNEFLLRTPVLHREFVLKLKELRPEICR